MNETAIDRLRANAVQVTSILVTALWMAAMFTGQDWWLAALLVGYIAVVPLAKLLFGEDESESGQHSDWQSHWERADASTTASERDDDPLETLRERYARGELTDEQFERKLERLLEVETFEDAEERISSSPGSYARQDAEERKEAQREPERER